MTLIEYIKRKNAILHKYTEITLVPDEQIKDLEFKGKLSTESDRESCPYCMIFNPDEDRSGDHKECGGCPMLEHHNECGSFDNDDTYSEVIDRLSSKGTIMISDVLEIVNLVDEWNADINKSQMTRNL